jgi:hypothetical protein
MFVRVLSVPINHEHRDSTVRTGIRRNIRIEQSGFGGLGVSVLVFGTQGSNPAEAVGFFRAKKSSARLPSEGK